MKRKAVLVAIFCALLGSSFSQGAYSSYKSNDWDSMSSYNPREDNSKSSRFSSNQATQDNRSYVVNEQTGEKVYLDDVRREQKSQTRSNVQAQSRSQAKETWSDMRKMNQNQSSQNTYKQDYQYNSDRMRSAGNNYRNNVNERVNQTKQEVNSYKSNANSYENSNQNYNRQQSSYNQQNTNYDNNNYEQASFEEKPSRFASDRNSYDNVDSRDSYDNSYQNSNAQNDTYRNDSFDSGSQNTGITNFDNETTYNDSSYDQNDVNTQRDYQQSYENRGTDSSYSQNSYEEPVSNNVNSNNYESQQGHSRNYQQNGGASSYDDQTNSSYSNQDQAYSRNARSLDTGYSQSGSQNAMSDSYTDRGRTANFESKRPKNLRVNVQRKTNTRRKKSFFGNPFRGVSNFFKSAFKR